MKFLDCTLRDGGYYNNWDFETDVIQNYLQAMDSLQIDFVEIGFRSLKNDTFKGALAYSTDDFLNKLNIPLGLTNKIGVMINGSEIKDTKNQIAFLKKLFNPKKNSPVTLVRIACHVHEFIDCLPASTWLKKQGYLVGFNLMQVSDRSPEEISKLVGSAKKYPIDVLYFADSMGSLEAKQLKKIIKAFQKKWKGALGIHTHDNIAQAINNSIHAAESGITWVDSTVTGMGRGPGNAQTEYIILALDKYRKKKGNIIKLFNIIRNFFQPMKNFYGWGTNPYYFIAGQKGIHPSYIQEMIQNERFDDVDILSVIDFLAKEKVKKFSFDTLEAARNFYTYKPKGKWVPKAHLKDKTVLILGSGPSVNKYKHAIENFIKIYNPYVIALNTQSNIQQKLINSRTACHPVRLLANYEEHIKLPQPLITPFSMLPKNIKNKLLNKEIFDYGLVIKNKEFSFNKNYCVLPSSLVIAYTIAIANSGEANNIMLAGFDGYISDDPRRKEMDELFEIYSKTINSVPIISITPTRYNLVKKSIFGFNK